MRKIIKNLKLFITLMVVFHLLIDTTLAFAHDNFSKKHAEGWHWYEDKKKNEEKEEDKIMPAPENATEKLERLKKIVKERLDVAIDNPTSENLKAYMEAQKVVIDKSHIFSNNWQRVLFTNPHLDETITNPVNQAANHIYLDKQKESKFNKIKGLANDYALIYFYKGSCPYCESFSPLVNRFSQKYNWNVMAISLDGNISPEFPSSKTDNGIATKLGIDVVPALIALHPSSQNIIPLAYGMVSETDIEDRINMLVGKDLKPWESK